MKRVTLASVIGDFGPKKRDIIEYQHLMIKKKEFGIYKGRSGSKVEFGMSIAPFTIELCGFMAAPEVLWSKNVSFPTSGLV